MTPLRLYDPDRRPSSWTEIIGPGQFVAFSKTVDTGGSCDSEGRPFPLDPSVVRTEVRWRTPHEVRFVDDEMRHSKLIAERTNSAPLGSKIRLEEGLRPASHLERIIPVEDLMGFRSQKGSAPREVRDIFDRSIGPSGDDSVLGELRNSGVQSV